MTHLCRHRLIGKDQMSCVLAHKLSDFQAAAFNYSQDGGSGGDSSAMDEDVEVSHDLQLQFLRVIPTVAVS